jgi:hypothetical protein
MDFSTDLCLTSLKVTNVLERRTLQKGHCLRQRRLLFVCVQLALHGSCSDPHDDTAAFHRSLQPADLHMG